MTTGSQKPPFPPAQKRLGQHFLVDPNIVRKILALADIKPEDTVLEIGPGRGILTRALCDVARSLIAVEVDRALFDYLAGTLNPYDNLDLRRGDALEFPYETLPPKTVVVANLPYYISTPLLFRLLDARARIDRMVLMLQAEVARRMVAPPGSGEYGILSVLTQFWTEPSLAFRVSSNCFRPPPEVDSAVARLLIRPSPAALVDDEQQFVRIVRAAFAHRRKTLLNSFRDEGWPADQIVGALEQAGINPVRRAETLTLIEFAALANAMKVP